MKVREAEKKDGRAIRGLIQMYPEKLIQKHLPRIKDFFVAVEQGKIVGCCALEIYSKRLAEIRSLAVHPEYQGKGIASKLINRCLRRARQRLVHEVLSITGRPALFERQGFGTFNRERFALLKVFGGIHGGGKQ